MRVPRLESLFCDELRFLFDNEINDARLSGVRITRVDLSPDAARVRVWFLCSESPSELASSETSSLCEPRRLADVQSALRHASGFLRSRLAEALPLKRAPELSFRCDLAFAAQSEDSI